MKIVIPNKNFFEKIITKIKNDGIDSLHIVSDFDRTLTYAMVNGEKIPSIISLLRDGKHLSEEYAAKAKMLFEKYHPIEVDESYNLKDKKRLMMKWWKEHYKLLIKYGLKKDDIRDVVDKGIMRFRDGVDEFLDVKKS
ncbi:MAG: hypothetical protein QXO84_02795 [Candidatus Aenigmatarchaeota archaeon]